MSQNNNGSSTPLLIRKSSSSRFLKQLAGMSQGGDEILDRGASARNEVFISHYTHIKFVKVKKSRILEQIRL
jgi:hypothetical protein